MWDSLDSYNLWLMKELMKAGTLNEFIAHKLYYTIFGYWRLKVLENIIIGNGGFELI